MEASCTLTNNVNIGGFDPLPSPARLQRMHFATASDMERVYGFRESIKRIIHRHDKRLLVIIGPCSIHDPEAGIEYAKRLMSVAKYVDGQFLIVMRVYFEKPRTSIGWKGLINDPDLNGSFQIEKGLSIAREFMLTVTRMGLPIATEALDPIVPQYLGDLVSWTAIGARTTESQTHREMASGLSSPVGFKNATDGDVAAAINAILSARQPHSFLGINGDGRSSVVRTRGNSFGHLVLRGSDSGTNYDKANIQSAAKMMAKHRLNPAIVVDCSHGNSRKSPALQPMVAMDVIEQVRAGEESIVGLMCESFLVGGNQEFIPGRSRLQYGCSITDACLGWDESERMLLDLARALG